MFNPITKIKKALQLPSVYSPWGKKKESLQSFWPGQYPWTRQAWIGSPGRGLLQTGRVSLSPFLARNPFPGYRLWVHRVTREEMLLCSLCYNSKEYREKYVNALCWAFLYIPLNAKIHHADTQCLAVISSHTHCYRFLPVSSVCTPSHPFVLLFSLLFPSPYSFVPNLFLFMYDLIYIWPGPILCEVRGAQVFRSQAHHFSLQGILKIRKQWY